MTQATTGPTNGPGGTGQTGAGEGRDYDAARRQVEARLGFGIHLAVYVVINVVFLIVVGLDFLWATVFWGVGIVFHAAKAFLGPSDALSTWKERAIQKEIARRRGDPTRPAPASSSAVGGWDQGATQPGDEPASPPPPASSVAVASSSQSSAAPPPDLGLDPTASIEAGTDTQRLPAGEETMPIPGADADPTAPTDRPARS